MIWECDIMNDNYENVILWMIWECDIMGDMRMWYYEWYEKIKLWIEIKI